MSNLVKYNKTVTISKLLKKIECSDFVFVNYAGKLIPATAVLHPQQNMCIEIWWDLPYVNRNQHDQFTKQDNPALFIPDNLSPITLKTTKGDKLNIYLACFTKM